MSHDESSPLDAVRADLTAAEGQEPTGALPLLRSAADRLTRLIDDTMAEAVLSGSASLRSAGAQAGLSENAVGPRLARTPSLAAYANEAGRVTAASVQRARYDRETGTARPIPPAEPLRFRPRRPT